MKDMWKTKLPYDLLEQSKLDFNEPVYAYDGSKITKGHFSSKHGVTIFISDFSNEENELDFVLWCWSKEFNKELDKLWVNWN